LLKFYNDINHDLQTKIVFGDKKIYTEKSFKYLRNRVYFLIIYLND